jgi:ParB/RepB/Spo0J family partition protein
MNAPEFATPPADAVAVASLPVAAIIASPSNPRKRFDDAYIVELADSIKNHGLIQPITVRPLSLDSLFAFNRTACEGDERPTYEIVVGECRWRAAKLAGLAEIPAFWRELDDKQVLEIQVIENLQRRDVHPIEEAEGYQALIARHGYTADQIAAKISKSRSYVYGRLKFASLCRDARDAFYDGRLDASVALLVARIPGETLQKKATKEVTCGYDNQPLSYRNAKTHILHRYTLSLVQATFKPDDATLLPKAGSCTDCDKLSGNCRDLFNDIDDPNVCTDPDCFEAKRQARRDQLIANAEKRKIPVFLGDQGRLELNGDVEYVSLDAEVDDDADGRTYRQILGDKAPVAAIIEFPYGKKDLAECAPLNALEAALRKAGWKPAEEQPYVPPDATPEQKKAAEAQAAKRKAEAEEWDRKKEAVAIENTWRGKLATELLRRIELDTDNGHLNTDRAIILLAQAWLQQNEIEYNFPEDMMARYGVELPEEFDAADEMTRIFGLMDKWSVGTALAFLFDAMTETTERQVNIHEGDIQPAHILLAAAALVNLDAEAFREPPPAPAKVQPKTAKSKAAKPASTPSDAAHASDVSASPATPAKEPKPAKKPAAKKAKAKADPAPAMPANEAATPPKTSAMPAWPFPTGARP